MAMEAACTADAAEEVSSRKCILPYPVKCQSIDVAMAAGQPRWLETWRRPRRHGGSGSCCSRATSMVSVCSWLSFTFCLIALTGLLVFAALDLRAHLELLEPPGRSPPAAPPVAPLLREFEVDGRVTTTRLLHNQGGFGGSGSGGHVGARNACTVPNPDKHDCFPDGGATQAACQARGCCWLPGNEPSRNLPWCYYAHEAGQSYVVGNVTTTPLGFSMTLMQRVQTIWPDNINKLQVVVMLETANRMHFKVYDPYNKRYEVPAVVSASARKGRAPASTEYTVELSEAGEDFALTVTRKSTGRIIFDSNGTRLTFADQVLRMTTALPSNNVYGLGERSGPLRCDTSQAQRYTMWTRDQPPTDACNLYGSHPFYMGLDDEDGTAFGVFLLNSNAMDVEITPGDPALLTYTTIGGIFDFYIFSGPTPNDVVQQYTEVIGRPFLPPYWALGFHLCRWGYGGTQGLEAIIDRMRASGFPYDVQWNDIDYMNAHMDWTLDNTSFAGLASVVDDLHSHGQHYVIIVDPAISNTPGYAPYNEGLTEQVFVMVADGSVPIVGNVWPGTTVYPDFSHPNASDWWTRQVQRFHALLPFDGLWTDMNEPSNFGFGSVSACPFSSPLDSPPYVPGVCGGQLPDHTLCPSARQYLSTHYNLHCLYGHLELMTTARALQNVRTGKRGLVITRSTFAGSGAHGGHWLGDNSATWSDLKQSLAGILSFNMFGIPLIGADICGFFGDTTEELCLRWMQLGAFYPFMRNHNSVGQKDQDPAAPWFSSATRAAMKAATMQRYYLLPYLYTLFYQAHANGSAVARPLFFQYPLDSATYSIDSQFLWGDALMVAPVLQPGMSQLWIYLPNDTWYDFVSGAPMPTPGKWQPVPVTLAAIPVYQRGGTVLPAQLPNVTTTLSRLNPFSVIVALDGSGVASGSLLWDDGESTSAFDSGDFSWIEFHATENSLTSSVLKAGFTGPMNLGTIVLRGLAKVPTSASVNGVPAVVSGDQQVTILPSGGTVPLLLPITVTWQ